MAKQEAVKKPTKTRKTQKITKRTFNRGSKAPAILKAATEHPELTTREIAKLADCDHSNVVRTLQRYEIDHTNVEAFKEHRGEILAGMQERIIKSITEADIKAMPVGQRLMGFGIIYDKERLERGQSTSNSVNLNVDVQDTRYRQYAGIGEQRKEPNDKS